jgi:hypothetical protein
MGVSSLLVVTNSLRLAGFPDADSLLNESGRESVAVTINHSKERVPQSTSDSLVVNEPLTAGAAP